MTMGLILLTVCYAAAWLLPDIIPTEHQMTRRALERDLVRLCLGDRAAMRARVRAERARAPGLDAVSATRRAIERAALEQRGRLAADLPARPWIRRPAASG